MKKTVKTTIYHLEFVEGPREGEHYYFGSVAAIFDDFSNKDIRTTIQGLYRSGLSYSMNFKNKICIIRKSNVIRKRGNRIAPVKVIRII